MRQLTRLIPAAFLWLWTGFNGFAQQGRMDKRFKGLDTAFERVLKEWHVAGFAVAVVEKNEIIYSNGFGYRDFENKIPVNSYTQFAIGSCTKAFTASLIGLLSQDQKLDIDKPVRNYLPDLKFYNDEMNDHITLRDMMCHRTGLPRHDFSWYFFPTKSRDSLVRRIQFMEPSAGIREKWQYNNFMFMLQGAVVEKLTGKSWEENIRERIFQPLGMTHSVLSIDELLKSPDAALGYDLKKDSIIHKIDYYHIDGMAPAGSINSSVNDMAIWVNTWIHGGKYQGKEILPPSYVSEALSSQMVVAGSLPDKQRPDVFISNYGFGWTISSYRGHYRDEHGGNINGFSANTSIFPSDSIGIIVLCNQDGSAVPSVVRNILADRILGLRYTDWESDLRKAADKAAAAIREGLKNKMSSTKKGTSPSHPLKDYEGIYTNEGYGSLEFTVIHDSLFASTPDHVLWLRHSYYDVFEPFEKDKKEGIDTSNQSDPLQFSMSKAGDIESFSMSLEPSVKPIVFTKRPKAKEISKDSLVKYTGDYELGPATLKVYIKSDRMLCLFVEGQPEYELVPIDKDKFTIKNLTGFNIQFNLNEKGQVIELLSIQPNGTFKATKKK
jgi:CubicO group peptidase (beta-lactamase class C family)